MRAFVTGTDSGVGKTYVAAMVTRALRRAGRDTVALKPLCSGDRADAEILRAAAEDELTLDEVNPHWFRAPVAPLVAARAERRQITLPGLREWFSRVTGRRDSVLVEGAGGWLAPLLEGATAADLCEALGLPVLLVVANRLGCVNHTLLTLESLRARGLACQGIVLNSLPGAASDASTRTNRALLEEFAGQPVLWEIAAGQGAMEVDQQHCPDGVGILPVR